MGTSNHPRESDLALLAGGETGRIRRFVLDRHVRACTDCREKVSGYHSLRAELADLELPDVNWAFLASDMRANIRLGLEAGACVRTTSALRVWNPRFAIAFASLILLVASSFFLRGTLSLRDGRSRQTEAGAAPVLRFTRSGVEFRSGETSMILLNRAGDDTNPTVSARGDIGSRIVDAGSVTINNVYLQ